MRITRLKSENFMKIKAIEITPDQNVVLITGKNGHGKSSLLSSIVSALGGKALSPEKPIRDGEDWAEVVVTTDEYVVTRRWTASGSTLEIKNKDGFKAPSPQALLDKIRGKIAFDPLEFCRLPAKEQREMLLKLVQVDVTEHDARIERLRSERSVAMAQKKRAVEDAEKIPFVEGLLPEPVSIKALADRLMGAQAANQAISQKEFALKSLREELVRQTADVAKLRSDLGAAEGKLALTSARLHAGEVDLAAMVPLDVTSLKNELAGAEELNSKILTNRRYAEAAFKAGHLGEQVTALYTATQEAEAAKAKVLADVTMPLAGLGVSDGAVMYKGIPLSQVNHAKQVEISMAIAMAMNPELRVMLVNGNGLDGQTMAQIENIVGERDYQLWIEQATDGEPVGIVIEDGQVKNVREEASNERL